MQNSIPIYIINLKRNPERGLFMKRQLDALHLDYQFVNAVDKYALESSVYRSRIAKSLNIDESQLVEKYDLIINRLKTNACNREHYERRKSEYLGQLAIVLSHIGVYELMIEKNLASVCVLEDDVTLLPTFCEILEAASKLSWDILLLSNGSSRAVSILDNIPNLFLCSKSIQAIVKRLLFLWRQLKSSSPVSKKDSRVKRLLNEYGFDRYADSHEIVIKALEEYDALGAKLLRESLSFDTLMRAGMVLCSINKQYNALNWYLATRLGAQPEKSSIKAISRGHCIAAPRYCPFSGMAYIVTRAAAIKWKQKALQSHFEGIDILPGQLYKDGELKLRIITPPCVIAAYRYLVHSIHYYHG